MKKRVLIAMSGGVDSSVAAALLKEQGYEAVGATLKIWPKEHCGCSAERMCCSLKDTEDAKKVCDALGIRHYVLNFEELFREEVIDYFTGEYLNGRTPNPCIVCNQKVKFGGLWRKARELECDFISTGHYAIIDRNRYTGLREAADKHKDQSYVLFSINREQLNGILFPIGSIAKTEIRRISKELNLPVHDKPESQEICFVPGNNYSDFIKEYCGIEPRQGRIIDVNGRVLGKHKGFWNFTIGQRRGMGIAYKKPLYVISIKAEENIIVVGERALACKKKFLVKKINWLADKPAGEFEAMVKIRYNHRKAKAVLRKRQNNKIEVEFEFGQNAITPGQAAVFYKGEYVTGGGWIDKVLE